MSTPRYRSEPPALSGSAISVSKAMTPSSPGLKSDIGVSSLLPHGVSEATSRPVLGRTLQSCNKPRGWAAGRFQRYHSTALTRVAVAVAGVRIITYGHDA